MKRYSPLAQLRKAILASRRQMADLLSMSESHYEKAEISTKSLGTSSLILLAPLENAFENLVKNTGLPGGILNCKRSVLNNHQRYLSSKHAHIKHELLRLNFSLRFIKENWIAGSAHVNFLLQLNALIPADHPSHRIIENSIDALKRTLQTYSPEQQNLLERYINALEEQERALREILNVE